MVSLGCFVVVCDSLLWFAVFKWTNRNKGTFVVKTD